MKKYEEVIIKEVCKECNTIERIVVKLFKKLFLKAYKIGITFGYNNK